MAMARLSWSTVGEVVGIKLRHDESMALRQSFESIT
jgi:hypothetical protein